MRQGLLLLVSGRGNKGVTKTLANPHIAHGPAALAPKELVRNAESQAHPESLNQEPHYNKIHRGLYAHCRRVGIYHLITDWGLCAGVCQVPGC